MSVVKTLIGNIKGAPGDKGTPGKKGDTGTRGSRWTSGTAVTGENTGSAVFPETGITDALEGDMYMNEDTCNVYRCAASGDAQTARWAYVGNLRGDKGDMPTAADDLTTSFEQAQKRENILSGEANRTLMGKIKKWFADMTAAAFAQIITSYPDLMANTVAGYLVDALAVKDAIGEVNSKLNAVTNIDRSGIYDFYLTVAKLNGTSIGFPIVFPFDITGYNVSIHNMSVYGQKSLDITKAVIVSRNKHYVNVSYPIEQALVGMVGTIDIRLTKKV